MSALHSSGDWQVHHSKKYNASYWFNSATGETSWSKPSGLLVSATKDTKVPSATKSSDEDEPRAKRFRSLRAEDVAQQAPRPAGAKVAIIVPFRDLHVEQKRSEHLKRFVPEMSRFLDGHEFVIYIIEQSDDKKEFNRGKLLNAGFHIASAEGCRVFIFHDVDLMPSAELLSYYTTVPTGKSPVHIARVWNRYNSNDKYFGGIISFSKEQFEEINGYPNNFWGWGGEDDELMKRAQEVNFVPIGPQSGSITDYEDMSLDEKLNFLRAHREWKCPNKWELLAEHMQSWRTNGLTDLQFSTIKDSLIDSSRNCRRILVDISAIGKTS